MIVADEEPSMDATLRRSGQLLLLCFLILVVLGAGRVRRDPLTDSEVDQIRDVAQEPAKSLKLYIKFAQARLLAVDQLRSDPKFAADRGQRIHDLLEDFGNIVDEIDDHIDGFNEHNQDLRKPLKEIIEADADWQMRLRTLKQAATVNPTAAKEAKD